MKHCFYGPDFHEAQARTYTEFYENRKNCVVADTWSQTCQPGLHIRLPYLVKKVSGHLYAPAVYCQRRSLRNPFSRRLGIPQSLSGHFGWKKNLLHLLGIEPRFLGRLAHNLIGIPTVLCCLPPVSFQYLTSVMVSSLQVSTYKLSEYPYAILAIVLVAK